MASTNRLIDRIIGDDSFRHEFYRHPLDLAHAAGLQVSNVELGALLSVPLVYFDEFSRGLPSNLPLPVDWQLDPPGVVADSH